MNLLPTGRASHTALKVSRNSLRVRVAICLISDVQSVGQPSCTMSSRGKENGKSNPASHGPGCLNQSEKLSKSYNVVRLVSVKLLSTRWPEAIVMPLLRRGADVKSTPCSDREVPDLARGAGIRQYDVHIQHLEVALSIQ